jgi:integrase/recombinase XerD
MEDVMLDRYFRKPCLVRRLRSCAAGPSLDDFAAALLAEGYARQAAARHIRDAAHLGEWASGHRIAIPALDEGVCARFERHLVRCRCLGVDHDPRTPFRARMFLAHLRTAGVVTAQAAAPEAGRVSAVIERYSEWMRRHRGIAETTLTQHAGLIEALLETIGDDPTHYDARGLRAFVLSRVKEHERHSGARVTAVVRSFLRYLVVQGRCSPDLIGAVPTVASGGFRSSLSIYPPTRSSDSSSPATAAR